METTQPHIEQSIDLFVIDNPLVDISVEVEDTSVMEKYKIPIGGAACNDGTNNRGECIPQLLKLPHVKTPGGCGTNSAHATAYALRQANYKTKGIVYFGGIGEDGNGKYLEDACKSQGVIPMFSRTSEVPTGATAALIYK